MTPREQINELLDKIEQLPPLQGWLATDGGERPIVNFDDARAMLALAEKLVPQVGRWQLEVASALAAEHYHGWALSPAEIADLFGESATVQVVDVLAASLAAGRMDSASILFPSVDNQGGIVHTTGTGRLRWRVVENGQLALTVSRPAGDVFTVTTREYPGGERGWTLYVYYPGGEAPFHVYHVETARMALRAVVEAGLIPASLLEHMAWSELLAQALPDPERPATVEPVEVDSSEEEGEDMSHFAHYVDPLLFDKGEDAPPLPPVKKESDK